MTMTPDNCFRCKGGLKAKNILPEFIDEYVDYGHARCSRCGITFDTNVNEIIKEDLSSAEALTELSEEDYRAFFVERSEIADEEGEIYTDFDWDDNDAVKQGVADHVLNALKKYNSMNIQRFADVGCGSGFMSLEISKACPGAVIYAIDPSPLVKKLEGRERLRVHQGTLQSAELEPCSFDAISIIGNWMLHVDPLDSLTYANRALKGDGTLVLDFKNVSSSSRVVARWALMLGLDRFGGKALLQRNFVNMRYGYTKEYVAEALNQGGFDILEIQSKPPRLLEFGNQSGYQSGVKGIIWRAFDFLDKVRNEQAWIQVVARKRGKNS